MYSLLLQALHHLSVRLAIPILLSQSFCDSNFELFVIVVVCTV